MMSARTRINLNQLVLMGRLYSTPTMSLTPKLDRKATSAKTMDDGAQSTGRCKLKLENLNRTSANYIAMERK